MSFVFRRYSSFAISSRVLAALSLSIPLGCSGAPASQGLETPSAVEGASSPTLSVSARANGWPYPAGWLYTSVNKILVSDGVSGGTTWMGRGVNIDDIHMCGYNGSL
ncbi:MAG: hypothetical protein JOZ69_00185, partial [Myxococcales bacterium]|nr:hypothetical protein [Myxococcales bacterium]